MCKTRRIRGWVLLRQPSHPNASQRKRQRALPFFISVCIFFFVFTPLPPCTFSQHHHHHSHQQKPWSSWVTFAIQRLYLPGDLRIHEQFFCSCVVGTTTAELVTLSFSFGTYHFCWRSGSLHADTWAAIMEQKRESKRKRMGERGIGRRT